MEIFVAKHEVQKIIVWYVTTDYTLLVGKNCSLCLTEDIQ